MDKRMLTKQKDLQGANELHKVNWDVFKGEEDGEIYLKLKDVFLQSCFEWSLHAFAQ